MTSLAEICGHTFYLPDLGPESVVVDLGASTAGFSAGVVRLSGCRCHCVEAAPKNFAAIEETDRITKHFGAMGGTEGPVRIHIPDDESHWGSIEPPVGFAVVDSFEAPGRTLPGLLNELQLDRVDLLKVDIEGAEIALFDATDDATLRRCRQISVEFHDFMDAAQGPDVRRVINRFKALGFDALVLTRRRHGDVLFIDRRVLGLNALDIAYFRTVVKYGRGLRRMIRRSLGRGGAAAA